MPAPRIFPVNLLLLLLLVVSGNVLASAEVLGERGAFRIKFRAAELFSEQQASQWKDFISMDTEMTSEVFVPDSYDPEKPAGVLTYVSPTRSGLLPEPWKPVLAERNLIWISGNKTGNFTGVQHRSIFAILGTELIRNSYTVDDSRLYITGFSGGGRMASILIHRYHQLYKGALYLCGVNHWEDLPKSDVDAMLQRQHVFLTGSKDFNLRDTVDVSRLYKERAQKNFPVMVIDGMGHRLPDQPEMATALDYLDSLQN